MRTCSAPCATPACARGGPTAAARSKIERDAEQALAGRDLRADVLKVAHHGSHTSTSADFVAAVHPRLALISCGRRNAFGHPHADVLRTLRDAGVRAWRTDRGGSI